LRLSSLNWRSWDGNNPRETDLPPEIEEDRPKHWEFLLLQRALRSAAEDINQMATVASTCGTDAGTFVDWVTSLVTDMEKVAVEWSDLMNRKMPQALGLTGPLLILIR
jgi:hypothetical protein